MSTEEKAKRERRPAARHRDVILGCIDERLAIMLEIESSDNNVIRIQELIEELGRSLKKGGDSE